MKLCFVHKLGCWIQRVFRKTEKPLWNRLKVASVQGGFSEVTVEDPAALY